MEQDDEHDEHAWPEAMVRAGDVRAWISSALPGEPEVAGPLLIHQAKEWGVTASFAVTGARAREVVFKASWLPLFADAPRVYEALSRRCMGRVPELLAWSDRGHGHTWSLFAPFEGVPVEEVRTSDALTAVARTLADIQVAMADLPAEETIELPRSPVADVPRMFDAVLRDLAERQAPLWCGEGRELATQFGLDATVPARLGAHRADVERWTRELLACGIPDSIDHVDLHWGNAVVQPGGRILIFDWEEAALSCPLFSLDRLLNDARELDLGEEAAWSVASRGVAYTATEAAVRDAYLGALAWGTRDERARAFALALRLAPVKTAYEGVAFADALGWGGEPSLPAAWAANRMLARWEA